MRRIFSTILFLLVLSPVFISFASAGDINDGKHDFSNIRGAFITVDTECRKDDSPELQRRDVFGKLNGKEYGIGNIIAILDKNQMKGVFFVDFSMYYFAEPLLRETLAYISKAGHDVQLHLHWDNIPPSIRKNRKQVISDAAKYFQSITNKRILAYRGGSYEIDNDIADALVENGILYEFSYLRGRDTCKFYTEDIGNSITDYKGFIAVPVTTWPDKSLYKMDVNFSDSGTIKAGISALKTPVIFLHSMSFLKPWDPVSKQTRLSEVDQKALTTFIDVIEFINYKKIKSLTVSDLSAEISPMTHK